MRKKWTWLFTVAAMAGLTTGQSALAQQDATASTPPPSDASAPVGLTRVTTLSDAFSVAYGRDPSLLSQRLLLSASDDRVAQARAQYGPSVTLNSNYGYTYNRFDITRSDRTTFKGDSGLVGLIITQPLFTSGRIAASVQAANANVAFQRESVRFVEQQTMLNVISSYVAVRRDTQLLDIANGNLALLDRQLSESDQRFKVREITRTDLDQVVTRVETGRAAVQRAIGALATSQSQFLQAVGLLAGDLAPLPELPALPQSIDDAQASAEAGNPLILAAQARERTSRAQVNQARSSLGPTVSLRGDASYGGIDEFTTDRRERVLSGQVQLQMPLYTSGQLQAAVRAAKSANESDWRLIDQSLRDVRFSVDSAWNQLGSSRASITYLANAVAAAQRAYDGAVIQLRSGARTTLDVLDLARDLLNARGDLVSVQAQEYLAAANLLSAMGRLDMRTLNPAAPLYDPEVHYRKVANTGDTPIVSLLSSNLDGIVKGNTTTVRPSRDVDAKQATPVFTPLPPPPAPGQF